MNYVLGVIMVCQCRFIDFNKYVTVVLDVDNGEVVCMGEKGLYGTLYFLLNSLELKLH